MRSVIFALFLLLPFTAMAQAQDNPIVARMTQYAAAYNAQDAAGVAAMYAEDAVLYRQGEPAIEGRQAILDYYTTVFSNSAPRLEFEVLSIDGFETNAVEVGQALFTIGGNQQIQVRYMHLWEVINDEILLTRDMFHIAPLVR